MKKKLLNLLTIFVLGTNIASANPITEDIAKIVADNFYKQNSKNIVSSVSLAYTETSDFGLPVYFAFNINDDDGFVIVSAEDAGHPIIGYSAKNKFVIPVYNSNISYWLLNRKKEIEYIRINNFIASTEIAKEWDSYKYNQKALNPNMNTMSIVAPLVQTTWNQGPYSNALCPGGSPTGCVATAMAQIMKFWNFPSMGHGSSSYCDCTSGGFTNNYGTLSANYGATTYNWGAMPLNVTSANINVATLVYHCGVSMEMDYDPNGSAAYLFRSGPGGSAESSYKKYFKYDSTTIHGYSKSSYSTDAAWITLLENELNTGRPIQYRGGDSVMQTGHIWVCDGYDANNYFHMNWGWGGTCDGMFLITNLTTTIENNTYNWIYEQAALLGIQPMPTISVDAGAVTVNSPAGTYCSGTNISPTVKIQNFGINTLVSCIINYKIDNNTIQTQNWNGSLASYQSTIVTLPSFAASSGSHTLTCYTTYPNGGSDGDAANDQAVSSFNVGSITTGASLPAAEGFESSVNLPSGWIIYNPNNDSTWKVNTSVAHTGSHCISFDNCLYMGSFGARAAFYTKSYNMSSGTSALNFDVAYARKNYQGTIYSDTLAVYASSDCGATWNQIYFKGGTNLETAPISLYCFAPSATQWRTETVDMSSYTGQPIVMIGFENRTGWGNRLYIDNINISNTITTGIDKIADEGTVITIFPNPFSKSATIKVQSLNNEAPSAMNFVLYDLLGKEVMRMNNISDQTIILGDQLSQGLYVYKVFNNLKLIGKGKVVIK